MNKRMADGRELFMDYLVSGGLDTTGVKGDVRLLKTAR
jgi:hypothetical protein